MSGCRQEAGCPIHQASEMEDNSLAKLLRALELIDPKGPNADKCGHCVIEQVRAEEGLTQASDGTVSPKKIKREEGHRASERRKRFHR